MVYKTYYTLRPLIPRALQISLRRKIAKHKLNKFNDIWPIDITSNKAPENWKGWPEKKKFAFVLSHDVDTQKGHDSIKKILDIEKELGFRSAFNIVPERYKFSIELIETIKKEGFEVNVHGLTHDGKLFSSEAIFNERAKKINQYLKQWQSSGFTAPSMHRNLEWLHRLNIDHSTSTFDTDPFEPQPDGVKTIFPFWVASKTEKSGYLEIPYTLPQDHLLYVILREKTIDIWKRKLKWIAQQGGMVLVNTHTDYMNFSGPPLLNEEYPVEYFVDLLKHLKEEYSGQYYHVLPNELTAFWKETMSEKK